MKNILCFILIITLIAVFPQFTVGAIDDYDEDFYNFAYNTLKGLNIIKEDTFHEDFTKCIDYRTFIEMIANIEGYTGSLVGYYGLNDNNMFRNINYKNAADIVCNVLGWSLLVNKSGVNFVAKDIGLNRNILHFDNDFNQYDAIIIIYNSLTAKFLTQTSYGDINSYSSGITTLGAMYKSAYYFEGTMISNKYSYQNSNAECNYDEIVILDKNNNYVNIHNTEIDTYDMLGSHTIGFYVEDKEGKKCLISVTKNPDANKIMLSSDSDIQFEFAARSITYTTVNGKQKKIRLNYNMDFILNGCYANDKIDYILSILNGDADINLQSFCIEDNNEDDDYDIIKVMAYNTVVVKDKNNSKFRYEFSGIDGEYYSYELDENENKNLIDFFNTDGKKLSFTDVNKSDILSIFQGNSSDICRIIVNNTVFDGIINSVEEDCKTIKLNITYENSSNNEVEQELFLGKKCIKNNIVLGDYYRFYIDNNGKIAAITTECEAVVKTGLFIKMVSTNGGLGSKTKLLMMSDIDSDNPTVGVLELSKNAKYNGKKISDINIKSINHTLFHTIFNYYLNSSGEIIKILGSDDDSGNDLSTKNRHSTLTSYNEKVDVSPLIFSSANHYGMLRQNSSTITNSGKPATQIMFSQMQNDITYVPMDNKIIVVPDITLSQANLSYADKYYKVLDIASRDYFHPDNKLVYHRITAYYENKKVSPKYLVFFDDYENKPVSASQITVTNSIVAVNGVSQVINPKTNQECLKIDCMYMAKDTVLYSSNAGVLDYATANSFLDISEGDLLFVLFDGNGDITYAVKYYDYDPQMKTGSICSNIVNLGIDIGCNNINVYNTGYFIHQGYLFKKGTTTSNSILLKESLSEDKSILFCYPKYIYIFDTKSEKSDKRFTVGKIDSGYSYFEDNNNYSTVVARQRNGHCLDIVFYK